MKDIEKWALVPNFPVYEVSDRGNVRRVITVRGGRAGVMQPRLNKDGYKCVTLRQQNRRKGFLVSRLVCEAFIGPCPQKGWHAAHWNGVRTDNRLSNLRWASHLENEGDKDRHNSRIRGENHANSKVNDVLVLAIRRDNRVQKLIAETYGISQSLVSQIKSRHIWQHLT